MKYLAVTQRDGSVWAVPVSVIAKNRAAHYAPEFGGDVDRSLQEDTMPLFDLDSYEIEDWAVNQMDWSNFGNTCYQMTPAVAPDFQEAWMSGKKEVIDVPEWV